MPSQHPEETGYGHVIDRYVARKDSDHQRYRDLKSRRALQPGWPHAEHSPATSSTTRPRSPTPSWSRSAPVRHKADLRGHAALDDARPQQSARRR
jgi:hypothetical protein